MIDVIVAIIGTFVIESAIVMGLCNIIAALLAIEPMSFGVACMITFIYEVAKGFFIDLA